LDKTNIVSRKHSDEKQAMADALRENQTKAEATLWAAVKGSRIGYKLRRQQIIDGFIADSTVMLPVRYLNSTATYT
jgi:very-short-patch-repair endonuclease